MPCKLAPELACLRAPGKNWWEFLAAWTVLPLAQLLLTPFFRPFRFSRLVFTYLLAAHPLLHHLGRHGVAAAHVLARCPAGPGRRRRP